jgi:hypothetical protein
VLWFEAMRAAEIQIRREERRHWAWVPIPRAAIFVAFVLVLILAQGAAAQAIKRLILTDGSYQTVSRWTEEGDRVRYFSLERGHWEELPASLVDWKATKEWNAQTAQRQEEELKQVSGEEVVRRKQEMLNNPQVAPESNPSLRLPPSGGVYLLEKREGAVDLVQVHGRDPDQNRHTTLNLFRQTVIPFARRMHTLELQGSASSVRAISPVSIFVDVEDRSGPIAGTEFRIVRLERAGDVRVVAKNSIGLSGHVEMDADYVPVEARKFSGDWWQLVPARVLEPGEYAVIIPEDSQVGLVWDFGIDK